MNKHHSDEAAFLRELQSGEVAAFRRAVSLHSPLMLATARRIVGSADAEDLVQEAWIAVYKQIGSFEGRAKLSTWLCRIVSNLAISALRKKPKEQSLTNDAGADPSADWFDETGHWAAKPALWNPGSPEQIIDADELQHCLEEHLGRMPDNQRRVLLLKDAHEQNFDEICNAMELSASNVRVLLHRGRLKLLAMVNHFQETGTC